MFGRILLILATISLFHAAYSVYEHLSRLKALGKPEGSLPLNTVYESILALILGTLGASLNAPPLKDITWASEMKKRTIDEMDSRLGFANYHSRGKSFLTPPGTGRS
ncbi:magnesium transporter [Melanogaster broomeanus]|nr:magnesium transporter [Melanogaster broomeanus]